MEDLPVNANSEDLLKILMRRISSAWQESGAPYDELEQRIFGDVYAIVIPHGGKLGSGVESAVTKAVQADFRPIWIGSGQLRFAVVNLSPIWDFQDDMTEERVEQLRGLLGLSDIWSDDPDLQIVISTPFKGIISFQGIFSEIVNSKSIIGSLNPGRRIISEYDMRYNPELFVEPLPRTEIERKLVEHVLDLDFWGARQVMEDIIDYELSMPRTQLSFLPRMSKRIEWVLIVLRVPRSRGDKKSARIYDYPMEVFNASGFDECRRLVGEFFSLLDDYYSAFRFSTGKDMSQITEFIRENYSNPNLNATMICDRFRISQSYLSHTFKQKTGLKLIDFIHMVRSEKIKELLKTTDLPISDIAKMSGYLNNSSMSRSFRRYEGQTPSEYRESHQ